MNIIYHIIFCGKIYCIIYCIRLKSKTLFQRDSKIQWIRKYWHLFPSHTEVLKWAVQIQVGFPLHRHSGAHVSPFCYPGNSPSERALSSPEWSKMGPGQTGKSERDQAQSINFILSKWCRSRTHHFHSRSIFENRVLWPHLVSKEKGKCNLGAGWGYAQERRMDLG